MSKLTVSSIILAKCLARISFCITKSPIVPILENVKMDWTEHELTLTTSDLQNTVRVVIPIEASEAGSICAPYELLKKLLDRTPEQPITLVTDSDTYGITIVTDAGKYKLAGENPVDYPKIPALANTRTIKLKADALSAMLGEVHSFCSTDSLRPAMTGVYLRLKNNNLLVSATNGHGLAVRDIDFEPDDLELGDNAQDLLTKEISLIMVGKVAALLAELGSNYAEFITLDINNANIHIVDLPGNLTLISRLIDERFPDFENAIPLNNPIVATLTKNELLSALRRIDLFANKTTHQLRFSFTQGKLVLSAEDLDYSNEGSEHLLCEYDGDPIMIGFDTRYVMLAVNSFVNDRIRIEMSQPNRAAIVLPAHAAPGDRNLSLMMPTMLHTFA